MSAITDYKRVMLRIITSVCLVIELMITLAECYGTIDDANTSAFHGYFYVIFVLNTIEIVDSAYQIKKDNNSDNRSSRISCVDLESPKTTGLAFLMTGFIFTLGFMFTASRKPKNPVITLLLIVVTMALYGFNVALSSTKIKVSEDALVPYNELLDEEGQEDPGSPEGLESPREPGGTSAGDAPNAGEWNSCATAN